RGLVSTPHGTLERPAPLPRPVGKIWYGGSFLRGCRSADFFMLWAWGRGRGRGMRAWRRSGTPPLAHSACRLPEPAGNLDRVDAGLPPPRTLVARAMHRTMMPATEWDRELIANLAA